MTGCPFVRFYAGIVLRGPTGQPLGTLCIADTRSRSLSVVQRSCLVTFGNLVEELINQQAELTTARQQVNHVTLLSARTGVPNETLFGDTLTHLIQLADKGDHFKMVKDVHGHQAGDRVLKHVASAIEENLRPTDLLARVGGEEFQVLLLDADIRQAGESAERIRSVLHDLKIRLYHSVVKITASVDCAQLNRDGEDIASLMRVGDQRLYEAKALERDRMVAG